MKKYVKLLWIILLVLSIVFLISNLKFMKSYSGYLTKYNKTCSLSLFTKAITNDTFFSIPLGKRILEEGFKKDDILTWHEGLEFTNDRWLFNVVIFLVYSFFGINGIVGFTIISTLLIGVLIFIVSKYKTKNTALAIFGTLIIMYFSRNIFYARAQILSFILFILEFLALEKLVETGKIRYSILLVIDAILLANIHASVYPIYFIIFLPYFAEWLFKFVQDKKIFTNINKFEKSDIGNIKILGITFFIALASGLLTPTGLTPYTILIRAFLFTDTSFIGECQPSNIHNNLPLFSLLIFSIGIMLLPKIKVKVRDLFLILGFGLMGILVFRGTFFFFLIAAFPVLELINRLIKEYKLGLDCKWAKAIVYSSLIIILGTLYTKQYLFIQRYDYVPKDMYPVEATEYILGNLDYENTRIFNGFNYGSYLEFKGIKSFIDSRSEVYTDEFNPGCTVLEDWLKVSNDSKKYEEVFEKYNITHALVNDNFELKEDLLRDKNYNLIYKDDNFSLFERIK